MPTSKGKLPGCGGCRCRGHAGPGCRAATKGWWRADATLGCSHSATQAPASHSATRPLLSTGQPLNDLARIFSGRVAQWYSYAHNPKVSHSSAFPMEKHRLANSQGPDKTRKTRKDLNILNLKTWPARVVNPNVLLFRLSTGCVQRFVGYVILGFYTRTTLRYFTMIAGYRSTDWRRVLPQNKNQVNRRWQSSLWFGAHDWGA